MSEHRPPIYYYPPDEQEVEALVWADLTPGTVIEWHDDNGTRYQATVTGRHKTDDGGEYVITPLRRVEESP